MKKVSVTFQNVDIDTNHPNFLLSNQRVRGKSRKFSPVPNHSAKTFSFYLHVGKHAEQWKVEGDFSKRTISLSGDASRTFFGHDLLIAKNEHLQMAVLVKILRAVLATVRGLKMRQNNIVLVNEASIVRHFAVGDIEAQREAMNKLYRNLVARFEGDVNHEGETFTSPGVVTVKRRGIGEVLRIHSATDLRNLSLRIFEEYMQHDEILDAYNQHLRFEFTLGKKLLSKHHLASTANWRLDRPANNCLDHLFKSFGLSAQCCNDLTRLSSDAKGHRVGAEKANTLIDDGMIRLREADEFMSDAGFDIFIAPEYHHWLEHGLHDQLQPDKAAQFSLQLRANADLFGRWWEGDDAISSIQDDGMVNITS